MSLPDQTLRIGWIGFHLEGVSALQAILKQGVRLEGVLTLRDEARAKRSAAANYASVLNGYGVPLYEVQDINDDESICILQRWSPDVVFVIGWSQILRPETLATARVGMIGAHASLLPKNRGSAPINWAVIKGETSTGNSLIWLADSVDAGDIIDQVPFPITAYDTCESLYEKVAESNRQMILRLLPRLFAGERPGTPQLHGDEAQLPRRRPKDGLIDWSADGRVVYDFVRALTRPYPGAFSWLDGKRWIVWSCAVLPFDDLGAHRPGQVVGSVKSPVASACGQLVACGKGFIVLLELEGPNGEILCGPELSERQWAGRIWTNGVAKHAIETNSGYCSTSR
jgi:methionyl-tRNA formyltransferase